MLAPVTEIFFLKGLPVLRHIPFLNRVPGVRGLAKVCNIDFPHAERQQLKNVAGNHMATFFLPNHPEFFTDWMIDKYVLARISPNAACWAAGSIVNGMGKIMQRFWLNNNLIAQIPGRSRQGKQYSVKAALAGQGVLLHPEGRVSWFGNSISPLFSGAAEMAIDACIKGSAVSAGFQSWLAPVIWKLRFMIDVKDNLLDECRYIEERLELQPWVSHCPARRVYMIYHQLAQRDYGEIMCNGDSPADFHLVQLRDGIVEESRKKLADIISFAGGDQIALIRAIRKWLCARNTDDSGYALVKRIFGIYECWLKLKICAFIDPAISQEGIAEHLKRIRADFCGGSIRDCMNQYIPQAAGSRSAHIRTVDPVAIHDLLHHNNKPDPAQIMGTVRQSMQKRLNNLVAELEQKSPSLKVSSPFYVNSGLYHFDG